MTSSTYQYDAFISYRRKEPDRAFARDLRKSLIAEGYKVAFDEVDFLPQASFLEEMERCVKESRFILAVLSPQYFESGNTQEEAIITKVMDMADRKRRLIPLMIEPVERPVWLYNLVGLDFTDNDPIVPPFDKLKAAMGNPLVGKADTSQNEVPTPHPKPSQPSDEKANNQPALSDDLQKRLQLTKDLSGLPNPQFEQVVFTLRPPAGSMPGSTAPLGDRVAALLNWAEGTGGCGLDLVESILEQILQNPR